MSSLGRSSGVACIRFREIGELDMEDIILDIEPLYQRLKKAIENELAELEWLRAQLVLIADLPPEMQREKLRELTLELEKKVN